MTATAPATAPATAAVDGFRERLGRCYELSGRHVLNAYDGSVLVHGSIQGAGNPRIGHAWVQLRDGAVFDPVAGQEFPEEIYALVFSARAEQVYDLEGVAVETARSGHWGPWPDSC